MKVLMISTYATSNNVALLSQCKAGFGYMVYDIARSVTQKAEVDALLNNYRYCEFESDGIKFLASRIGLFLKNIFKCCAPILVVRLWQRYHMQLRTIVRILYVWFISGYYYDVIKKGNYDVVHIHGCGFYDEFWMDICHRLNQKFIITLHGLNSFSESVTLEPAGKRYERDFLLRVVKGEFPITVISTGIKRTIEKAFGEVKSDNIFVVCNSVSFRETSHTPISIRAKYGIPLAAKILLYVGNISKNKNQMQLIESFGLMPEGICKNTYVLFCGRHIEQGYSLEDVVKKSPYCGHFIFCGNVDKNDMPSYYEQADGVVLLSIAEGFGLSIIESMRFGKPCMTFCDLDAFEDIYSPSAIVALADRSNQTVANGLLELLNREWNKDLIERYSMKFDNGIMADNYVSVYKHIKSE